ncbi:MAG: hypothetical protein ACRCVW_01565 [Brevinema sp.]
MIRLLLIIILLNSCAINDTTKERYSGRKKMATIDPMDSSDPTIDFTVLNKIAGTDFVLSDGTKNMADLQSDQIFTLSSDEKDLVKEIEIEDSEESDSENGAYSHHKGYFKKVFFTKIDKLGKKIRYEYYKYIHPSK